MRENAGTLKKFNNLFMELKEYKTSFDIPDELADEFLKTSEQLKW